MGRRNNGGKKAVVFVMDKLDQTCQHQQHTRYAKGTQ